jgi:hypothetical protein
LDIGAHELREEVALGKKLMCKDGMGRVRLVVWLEVEQIVRDPSPDGRYLVRLTWATSAVAATIAWDCRWNRCLSSAGTPNISAITLVRIGNA